MHGVAGTRAAGKTAAKAGAQCEEEAGKGGGKSKDERVSCTEQRVSCTPRTPRHSSGTPGIAALGFGPALPSPGPWSLVPFPSPMLEGGGVQHCAPRGYRGIKMRAGQSTHETGRVSR